MADGEEAEKDTKRLLDHGEDLKAKPQAGDKRPKEEHIEGVFSSLGLCAVFLGLPKNSCRARLRLYPWFLHLVTCFRPAAATSRGLPTPAVDSRRGRHFRSFPVLCG